MCKAPTLRLKALNKHTHIMYIEMENIIHKKKYVYINKCSSIIVQKMHTHTHTHARTHNLKTPCNIIQQRSTTKQLLANARAHTDTHTHNTHTHTHTHGHIHTGCVCMLACVYVCVRACKTEQNKKHNNCILLPYVKWNAVANLYTTLLRSRSLVCRRDYTALKN